MLPRPISRHVQPAERHALVDTQGKGVERITEKGVVAERSRIELDCLIYSTEFEVGTDYTRRIGFEVTARDGKTRRRSSRIGPRRCTAFFTWLNPVSRDNHAGRTERQFQHMLVNRPSTSAGRSAGAEARREGHGAVAGRGKRMDRRDHQARRCARRSCRNARPATNNNEGRLTGTHDEERRLCERPERLHPGSGGMARRGNLPGLEIAR